MEVLKKVSDPVEREWIFSNNHNLPSSAPQALRLLSVDAPLVLPVHHNIRALISSTDVLHSWAVPALGIKLDACPGRLNEVGFTIQQQGIFYGQCSEICGVNHAFMPIEIVTIVLPEEV